MYEDDDDPQEHLQHVSLGWLLLFSKVVKQLYFTLPAAVYEEKVVFGVCFGFMFGVELLWTALLVRFQQT